MITPRYIFNSEKLVNNVVSLKCMLPSYKFAFSVKTNSHPSVVQCLSELGLRPEVVSNYEYEYVSEVLQHKHQMIINGPVKTNDLLSKCIESGDFIQASSLRELRVLNLLNAGNCLLKVGLRLNIGNEWGKQDFSRFGVEIHEELKKTLSSLNKIEVVGIHLHLPERSINSFYRRIEFMSQALIIFSDWGLKIEFINFGGGLPSKSFGGLEEVALSLEKFAIENPNIKFAIEPGTSIMADIFSYECSVVDVVKLGNKFIIQTDGSRLDFSRALTVNRISGLYRQGRLIAEFNLKSDLITVNMIVSGSSCIETDFMGGIDGFVDVKEGDVLRINSVGSYSYVFKSPFITTIPPVYDYLTRKQLSQSPTAADYISYVVGR